eukprot:scaffold1231_cov107-Cylindrotheca_fusiformis.AAC.11
MLRLQQKRSAMSIRPKKVRGRWKWAVVTIATGARQILAMMTYTLLQPPFARLAVGENEHGIQKKRPW